MLLRALVTELNRNLDIARSTRNLLTEKRDMLQGDVKKRLVVHQYHTDVWDSMVYRGGVDQLESPETVAECYERLKELNELIDKFDAEGDAIIHSPLISRKGHDYGREHIISILKELCEEAESTLHDAHAAVDDQVRRTCSDCNTLFGSSEAREAHERKEHNARQNRTGTDRTQRKQ